jgi:hypothetical protein
MRNRSSIAALVTALALSSAAQSTPDKPKPQPASATVPTPIKLGRSNVVLSGSIRTRFENWNFFDSVPPSDGEYTFSGNLLRLSLSEKREDFDWQIEGAVPFLLNLPSRASAPAPQGVLGLGGNYFASANDQHVINIFVKQAFIRFTGSDDKATTVRFGRYEFIEGLENRQPDPTLGFLKRERIGHRLIGNFGFSHMGRSFDGIEFKRDDGKHNLTITAARATRGVFQTDGNGELDVDIAYAGYTRIVGAKTSSPGEFRIFGMHYHDGRTGSLTTKVDSRPAPIRTADRQTIRLGTVGGHLAQTAKVGAAKADMVLWAALQFGAWGVLDQRSGAIDVEGGIQFANAPWKPWLRGGYAYHSGDDDPTDGTNGTFFEMLSTPRIYARFPFYNRMNLRDAFGQLILRPHKNLTLRAEGHVLRLTSPSDLWYAGGGAFAQRNFGFAGRPSGGSKDLGEVIDFGADWNVNRNLTLSGYYAHAFGGRVIRTIFPSRENADFAYIEAVLRF